MTEVLFILTTVFVVCVVWSIISNEKSSKYHRDEKLSENKDNQKSDENHGKEKLSFRTHYDNLKVARDAPASVIKAAYKALMQQYHPDKFEGSEQEALRIAKLIKQSYDVLIDPVSRAKHDRWIDEQAEKTKQQNEKAQFGESTQQYHQKEKTQYEYTPSPEPEHSKGSTPAESSTPEVMNKFKRWLIRIVGFLLVLLIYSLWKEIDKETGNPTALLRGAFVGISLYWITKISNAKSVNKKLNYPEKTNSSTKAWLFVVGLVIFVIWIGSDQENKNTLPVSSTVPTQTTPVQQATPSSTNSAQDIFDRANNLYMLGRYSEAFPLYQNLAQYSGAQIKLGEIYENGNGVTKDYNQAIYWYRKAAEIGDENEKDALVSLNRLISQGKNKISSQVQTQPAQATPSQSNKPYRAGNGTKKQRIITSTDYEYTPPKIPGDTNNDGTLSGSEQGSNPYLFRQ